VVTTAASDLVNGVKIHINSVKSFLSGAWSTIKSTASSAWNSVVSSITSKLSKIRSSASSVVNAVKGYFSGLGHTVTSIVHSITASVGTILSLASKAANAVAKINPFGATYEFGGFEGDPPVPPGFPQPAGSMAMGSFQGDLNSMQSAANKLNRTTIGKVKTSGVVSSAALSAAAQKIYEITINAAPNAPTEDSLLKVLSYADTLYAS
jgi:hypothetical protein